MSVQEATANFGPWYFKNSMNARSKTLNSLRRNQICISGYCIIFFHSGILPQTAIVQQIHVFAIVCLVI
jgi:hypothetical protein